MSRRGEIFDMREILRLFNIVPVLKLATLTDSEVREIYNRRFGTMERLISAKEARDSIPASAHSSTYDAFLSLLKYEIKMGRTSFKLYIQDKDDLRDWELDEIREKGYNICWNSACLWYEVSF